MQLETLQQLKALGFFGWVKENYKRQVPTDMMLINIFRDELVIIGLSGLIYKYFRDKHNLHSHVGRSLQGFYPAFFNTKTFDGNIKMNVEVTYFTTFELAEEALFLEMIKYVKK